MMAIKHTNAMTSTIMKVVQLNPLRGSAITNKAAFVNVWHFTSEF